MRLFDTKKWSIHIGLSPAANTNVYGLVEQWWINAYGTLSSYRLSLGLGRIVRPYVGIVRR